MTPPGARWFCLLVLAVALIVGCSVEVEVPKPRSAAKISDVLEGQLTVVEEACRTGELSAEHLSALNMSVVHLQGHLKSEGKASDDQLADLDHIHRQLVRLRQGGQLNPEDVKTIVANIRSVLASLPDAATGG